MGKVLIVNYCTQVSLIVNEKRMDLSERELNDGDVFGVFDQRWKWKQSSRMFLLSQQLKSLQSKLISSNKELEICQQQLSTKQSQLSTIIQQSKTTTPPSSPPPSSSSNSTQGINI